MQEQQQKQHRDIGQFIYKLWTRNGSDEAGYADAVFDGRLDALGRFMTRGEAFGDEPEGGGITRTPVQIDRRHCKDLSYSQFCDTYMFVNRPVVISGLSDHWKSRELWVAQNDDGNSPNLSYFQQSFGNSIAPVFEQNSAGFGTARPVSRSMSVGEYATWWHNFKQRRGMDDPTDDDDENDKATTLLYLKDWKFVAANPEYDAYEWPIFFRDDWLNEAMGNAYKFVYLGPKGTSTVLHADVIRSFSWSTNICGEKRWYLVPPEQSFLLYDCFGRQLASHLEVDVQNPGLQVFFPGLALVRKYAIQIMQQAGETLFVPSNWFHTVENTQDTLSINHNWVNRANILLVWQHVESELRNYRTNHVVGPGIDLSYKSTNGETINPMTRTASANRSQIDDDLHLLWHVLSTKAMSILDHSHILDANAISDLETILCILDKILAFQMEDKRPDVQTTLDVTSLRIQVATAICAVH